MKSEYKTILLPASGEIIEKKSKFIANIKHISSVDEANSFLEEMRTKYWDATHNVYAYSLYENKIAKFSDDGEPAGTSGLPSYKVLEGEGIYDVIVVITRYFGGTLLGTGGLVRAYSDAVKAALNNAEILTCCMCDTIKIKCNYSLWGKIENILRKNDAYIDNLGFGVDVEAIVCRKQSESQGLINEIVEKTDSNALVKIIGSEYSLINKEGKPVKIY